MDQKNIAPFSFWDNHEKIIADSLTQLSEKTLACRAVRIMAKSTNTGNIMIGSKNLTTSNFTIFLEANEAVDIEIEDVTKIYLIAAVNGEGVNYHHVV